MSWRQEIKEEIEGVTRKLSSVDDRGRDLDVRFRRHVRDSSQRPRIKIEHNPTTNMYQWEIFPAGKDNGYGHTITAETPFCEGRADSYQAAMDAVIYHEARLRLGLPNKPNGVTKNY